MKKEFNTKWYVSTSEEREDKEYISKADLRELVAKQLKGKFSNNFALYTADLEYYLTPLDDAKEIIKNSAIDRYTWVEERFDCDDFAHVLKSNFAEAAYKDGKRRAAHCFGIVWGSLPSSHAINWMVNDDYKLRFIEPQTDAIFLPRDTDKNIWFMLV